MQSMIFVIDQQVKLTEPDSKLAIKVVIRFGCKYLTHYYHAWYELGMPMGVPTSTQPT